MTAFPLKVELTVYTIPVFVASFRIPQKIMGTTNPAWWISEVMNLKREC